MDLARSSAQQILHDIPTGHDVQEFTFMFNFDQHTQSSYQSYNLQLGDLVKKKHAHLGKSNLIQLVAGIHQVIQVPQFHRLMGHVEILRNYS